MGKQAAKNCFVAGFACEELFYYLSQEKLNTAVIVSSVLNFKSNP